MCVSDSGTATNPAYPVFDGKTGKILPRGTNIAYPSAPTATPQKTTETKPKTTATTKKAPAPTAAQLALKNRLGVVFEYQKKFR